MDIFYYKSPIGILKISIENNFIISINIVNEYKENIYKNTYFNKIKRQLDEYFLGKRKEFNLNILMRGSEFQKQVWLELQKIPYGSTKSYKDIAEKIGNPNSQRAVGQACNKNNILIIIPCHRVISKNGDLNGFSCGLDIKEKLLSLEKIYK